MADSTAHLSAEHWAKMTVGCWVVAMESRWVVLKARTTAVGKALLMVASWASSMAASRDS